MTEKDYLRELGADLDEITLHAEGYKCMCLRALKLAKENGAKFDSEKVELPSLVPQMLDIRYAYPSLEIPQATPTGLTVVPTIEQCNEIIRRCRVIDRLREYIKSRILMSPKGPIDVTPNHLSPVDLADILAIINGQE